MTIVRFLTGVAIESKSGRGVHSFYEDEVAAVPQPIAAMLIVEGKAEWVTPDDRPPTLEAGACKTIEKRATGAHYFQCERFAVGSDDPNVLNGDNISSVTGPEQR
jgi:hypothetical protein